MEVLCVTVQTKSQSARKQLCRKESRSPSGQQVEHESAVRPWYTEGQLYAGLYFFGGEGWSQGHDSSPLFGPYETLCGILHPVQGSPIQEGHACKVQWRATMLVRGLEHISSPSAEAETTRVVQPEGGRSYCCLQLPTGRVQRGSQALCTLPLIFWQYTFNKSKRQAIPSRAKAFSPRGWSNIGTGCPEWWWSLNPWSYSALGWPTAGATCSNLPCFGHEVGLDHLQR